MHKLYPRLGLLAGQVIERARAADVRIATAESCTGGLVAAALTEIAGSSAVLDCGFVTYSNAAKTQMLGVPATVITAQGAVSQEVARAMADGARNGSNADFAVSITGIAGPGGGSPDKPVGLVWFALAARGRSTRSLEHRFGDVGRAQVRALSAQTALRLLLEAI